MFEHFMSIRDMVREYLVKDASGITMIDYVLLASLVSIAAVTIIQQVRPQIETSYYDVLSALQIAAQ